MNSTTMPKIVFGLFAGKVAIQILIALILPFITSNSIINSGFMPEVTNTAIPLIWIAVQLAATFLLWQYASSSFRVGAFIISITALLNLFLLIIGPNDDATFTHFRDFILYVPGLAVFLVYSLKQPQGTIRSYSTMLMLAYAAFAVLTTASYWMHVHYGNSTSFIDPDRQLVFMRVTMAISILHLAISAFSLYPWYMLLVKNEALIDRDIVDINSTLSNIFYWLIFSMISIELFLFLKIPIFEDSYLYETIKLILEMGETPPVLLATAVGGQVLALIFISIALYFYRITRLQLTITAVITSLVAPIIYIANGAITDGNEAFLTYLSLTVSSVFIMAFYIANCLKQQGLAIDNHMFLTD